MSKQDVCKALGDSGVKPGEIEPGETVNVNHTGCPAGEDTRGRLYVTRKPVPKDLLVWYCHNCGNGGAFKAPKSRVRGAHTFPPDKVDNDDRIKNLWLTSVSCRDSSVPDYVLEFLSARHWNGHEYIRWHPMEYALLFGVWRTGRPEWPIVPEALQVRRFFDQGGSTQWETIKGTKMEGPLRTHLGAGEKNRVVVITEDLMSAHRIYCEHRDFRSYCLFGAHASMDDLAYLIKEEGYGKIVVWLDNDGPQIEKSRERIAKRAEMLGAEVRVDRVHRDPKYVTDDILTRKWEDYPSA